MSMVRFPFPLEGTEEASWPWREKVAHPVGLETRRSSRSPVHHGSDMGCNAMTHLIVNAKKKVKSSSPGEAIAVEYRSVVAVILVTQMYRQALASALTELPGVGGDRSHAMPCCPFFVSSALVPRTESTWTP